MLFARKYFVLFDLSLQMPLDSVHANVYNDQLQKSASLTQLFNTALLSQPTPKQQQPQHTVTSPVAFHMPSSAAPSTVHSAQRKTSAPTLALVNSLDETQSPLADTIGELVHVHCIYR